MTRDVFGRQRADFARVSAFEPLATNRATYRTNSTLLSRRVSNPFILFSVVVDLTVSRQTPIHPPQVERTANCGYKFAGETIALRSRAYNLHVSSAICNVRRIPRSGSGVTKRCYFLGDTITS